MKLSTNADETFTLVDEVGNSIHIEDTDELLDLFLELEKFFGPIDPEVRYRELTEQLAKLTKVVQELKA